MRQFVEKLLSEVQRLNDVGKRMQDLYERSLMENSLIASRQQSKPVPPHAQARIEDLEEAITEEDNVQAKAAIFKLSTISLFGYTHFSSILSELQIAVNAGDRKVLHSKLQE